MSSQTVLPLLALCGLLVGVAGCNQPSQPADKGAQAAAAGPAAEPPALWRIEVLNGADVVSAVEICADRAVQQSFMRPEPAVGDKPCLRVHRDEPVAKDGIYSVRCRIDDQVYRVGAVSTGDLARDFTVDMAVSAQGKTGPTFEQLRRYRKIGACPAGWVAGDSAAPGAKTVLNTLSGASRPSPSPAQ